MNKREKILAAALGAVLLLFGAQYMLSSYRTSSAARQRELDTAKQNLDKATLAVASGRHAQRQLMDWQDLSLPTNRDVAHSIYRSWLLQKTKAAGLSVDDINPNERTAVSTAYQSIGYVIDGHGTLAAVTKFLYEFYSAKHLQQITKLQLTAKPGSSELSVQLHVEALILPGATNTDKLPEGKSDRLKLSSAAEYEKKIVGRDLFKPYTPPRPPREIVRTPPRPPAPEFDKLTQTYVTGILGSPTNLQAWITIRTTGEVLRVQAGDDVEVGELKGKVESVSPFMVVIKTEDDKKLRVKLGQNIREAEKASAEVDEAAAKGAKETEDS